MNSTAESIFLSNSDFEIRERCRAREDAIVHEKYQEEMIKTLTNEKDSLKKEVIELSDANSLLSDEVERLKKLLKDNGITS